MSLTDFEARVSELDESLRPIADHPVDITKPGWANRLAALPRPLDEAGVRAQTESLLRELIAAYRSGDASVRTGLRKLFSQYRAFAWAACLPSDPTSADGFREQLLLFSLKDQGLDSRDAILVLEHLCREAKAGEVDAAPILQEVAELSSEVNRFKMGSTKAMLLKAVERF